MLVPWGGEYKGCNELPRVPETQTGEGRLPGVAFHKPPELRSTEEPSSGAPRGGAPPVEDCPLPTRDPGGGAHHLQRGTKIPRTSN